MSVEGRLKDMKVSEAREVVVEWLREEGLLENEETITHNISTAERTGGIIEPLPKLQWFIDVNKEFTLEHSEIKGIESGSKTTLKRLMRLAVENGQVNILGERFEKTYFHWIDNLRDWCISRQIWFGHRIPVWYRGEEVFVGTEAPKEEGFVQDEDVLDTWFSSALWTFSTLGWPEETPDLKHYHPTTLIETGYDILPFWVARMILMSGALLGQVPFKTVYLHGIVRDGQGRKISKSLGNNIDPLDMGKKYGTDAVRVSLIMGMAQGTDSKISEDKIRGYKNFANKLWNIARYVQSQERQGELKAELIEELDSLVKEITGDLEEYRIHLAIEKIYHYVWHKFADEIIEESKGKPEYGETLYHILEVSLKLLHPFMPFVTEEIWSSMPHATGRQDGLLMIEPWPA
jgi:valyl-tRNA synthetase